MADERQGIVMDADEPERITLIRAMKVPPLWEATARQGVGPIMGFGCKHSGSPSLLFSQTHDGRFVWWWYVDGQRTILTSAEPFPKLADAKADAKNKLSARLTDLSRILAAAHGESTHC
jgi:hypothetical protein